MADMETVINCLRLCDGRAVYMGHGCEKCSYLDGTESGEECIEHLHADALTLLKQYDESWKRVKYSVIDAQMSVPADDEKTYDACKWVVEWMDREEKRWKDD